MTTRLTHICLHVESVAACARFYRRYCGLDVLDDRTNGNTGSVYLAAQGAEGGLVLQIMGGGADREPDPSDDRHLGFEVSSAADVDAVAGMAREDGCLVWKPDEYVAGAYLCTVSDPSGNCVEFSVGHPVPPRG